MDIVSPIVRSRMMSGIKGKNTRPELLIRKILFSAGYRFRLHRRDLPGVPDMVLPKYQAVIFVHGCFWHMHEGCRFAKLPSSSKQFWHLKLSGNRERDCRNVDRLMKAGWRVLVVWECMTRSESSCKTLPRRLESWLKGHRRFAELPARLPKAEMLCSR